MKRIKFGEFSRTHKIIAFAILAIAAITGSILISSGQFNIVYLILRGHDYKIFGKLFPLLADNFFGYSTFLHPNWWKVLLGILGFLVVGFLIVEKILLNYKSIHENIDQGLLPDAWLIYYFAAAGCIFGIQPFPELGTLHTSIFFAGVLYLLLASLFIDKNLWLALPNFLLVLLMCSLVYLFCFVMIWIALIFLVIAVFKTIGALGVAGGSGKRTVLEDGRVLENKKGLFGDDNHIDSDGNAWEGDGRTYRKREP